MYQIGVSFRGTAGPLDGQRITARGLHGLFYYILEQADGRHATWLHNHPPPKPYRLAPYYQGDSGILAGMSLAAVTDEATEVILQAWQKAQTAGRTLRLGPQTLTIGRVACVQHPGFESLAMASAEPDAGLRFLSPTAFKQGPGVLPLPLPRNVFERPYAVWQAFAPKRLRIAGDWLEWCGRNVFIVAHEIETVQVTVSKHEPPFTGFIGDVWFQAQAEAALYLSIFQSLARLAAFSGVGWKTTMGMGAVMNLERKDA